MNKVINNNNNNSNENSDSFSDYEYDYDDGESEEDLIGASIYNSSNNINNNDDQLQQPLLLNIDNSNNINIKINNDNSNHNNKIEEIKNKPSFFQHKYLKEVLLIYALFSLIVTAAICYGLFIPSVILDYVKHKYTNLSPDQIQSKAAYVKSFVDAIPYIFMFAVGPFAGAISDKYGRKKLLYWGALINILDMISCLITIKTKSLVPFFICHSVAGTANVSLAAMFSYLSDITEPEMVPTVYTMTGMAMGFGVIIGPICIIISSLFPNQFYLTLYISIGICVLSIVIIIFLKESLTIAKENNQIKSNKRTLNPFKLIKRVFSSSAYVSLVIGIYTLVSFSIQDVLSTYVYSTSLRYNWTSRDTSYFMAGSGVFMLIWSILIVPTLLKYYSERKVTSFALLVGILSRAAYAFAFNQYIWMVSAAFSAFLPSSIALLNSIISRAIPPNIRGSVLTGVQAVGSLSGFLGSLCYGNVYSFAISKRSPIFFPGAPYLLTSFVLIIAFIASLIIWKKYSNPNPLKRRSKIQKSRSFAVN